MKILITGSEGFIGSNLLDHFKNYHDTFCIGLDDFYNKDKWRSVLNDLLNNYSPDVVFHVGACSDTLEKDVKYMMELNYESTKIITDWCCSYGRKIVYSSSAANYGTSGIPSNLYGWSKYTAEGYVISRDGVALRYFNVYGNGEEHKGNMASFVYQSFLKRNEGRNIMIFPGSPQRDFVYIEDVVSANIFAFENFDLLKGDWYDVGSGESRKFEDILFNLGIEDFVYTEPSNIPEGYQFYTKSSKFMKGWKPKYNLESGIKDYIKRLEHE